MEAESSPNRVPARFLAGVRAAMGVSVSVALLALALPAFSPSLAEAGPGGAGAAPAAGEVPAAPGAAAGSADPAAGWRTLPIWGGDIRSLTISPDDPDVVLAGTTTGQLYLSHDGGLSWRNAGVPLPFPGWVVSSLQWDPNHRGRLWVALWGVWGGGQVAFSDNLGRSWSARSGGLPEEPVYSLALVPGTEGRLFAGTLSGVWGTDDGGGSWRRLTAALPEMEKVTSLVVDPTQPSTVIAGTWRQAYRSVDGGASWSGVFNGMVLDTEIFSFTPIPEHPGEIWASSCGWVYQTLDRGDHWVRFKDGLDERRTLSFAAPADGPLLAGTVSGVFASTDLGKSWKRISDPALSVTAIAVHPARPGRILVGTEGAGVWQSTDGGGDFFRSSRGMTATRVGALLLTSHDLLVAINHAGPVSGVYVSTDRGRSFTADFSPLPTVLDLKTAGGHAYAATVSGLFERRGADWHRVTELGTGRVEQIVAAPGQPPVVRTGDGFFELSPKGGFVRRPYKHGPPLSAAMYGDALWVSDAAGVYELTRDANHTVPAPAGGRLHRLGEDLLLAGQGGVWVRTAVAPAAGAAPGSSPGTPAAAPGAPRATGPAAGSGSGSGSGSDTGWTQISSDASRLLETGDSRFGAVLLSGDTLRLYDQISHRFRPLPVQVPVRDVDAAVVVDDELLLATSGYGVLAHAID